MRKLLNFVAVNRCLLFNGYDITVKVEDNGNTVIETHRGVPKTNSILPMLEHMNILMPAEGVVLRAFTWKFSKLANKYKRFDYVL